MTARVLAAALVGLLFGVCPALARESASKPARHGHLLHLQIPADVSKADVRRADESLRVRLHKFARDHLARLVSEASREDDAEQVGDIIVLLADQTGEPILPDLESSAGPVGDPSASVPADANTLSFTFNSSTYPWSADELATLSTALNEFYPIARAVYGDPAFNIAVNLRKDPTIAFAGLYYPSLNEMVISDAASLDALCHEMIHAFRDDNVLLASYEEGMTRTAEVEIFSRLAAYTHPFDENHSYTYDVYYEALNRSAIGSAGGNFWAGYVSPLLRYQLAGYAWAKPLLENASFLADFNRELYARILVDPTIRWSESALADIVAAVQPTVEGKPFESWRRAQGVLNANPPAGYVLYQRINQFTVDYFYRDASGSETMQSGVPVQWAVYDHQDTLLDSGSEETSALGTCTFWPLLPPGYTGRIKAVVTASSPQGTVSDESFTLAGNATGVFGIVLYQDTGTVTIASLDVATPDITTNVVNGGFAVPSLASVKGRFRATFNGPNGEAFSQQFTKDASDYFLFLAVDDTEGPIRVPTGCQITSGQVSVAGTTDPDMPAEILRATAGGRVGARCGCISAPDESGRVQGDWEHVRKRRNGTFRARDYSSLVCGCDGVLDGALCGGDTPVEGAMPPRANTACFSGVGEFSARGAGKKIELVAFRVDVEDRGEPAAGTDVAPTDIYRIRIWIPATNESLKVLADAISCVHADPIGAVGRVANIDEGGSLVRGNIEIVPQAPDSDDTPSPAPDLHQDCLVP